MVFVRFYNHYYKKINYIKIKGFRIINNQLCILIKYNTNADNILIIFQANEQIDTNNGSIQKAKKGKIKIYVPTNIVPSCTLYFALVTMDDEILAQDKKIYGWGWEK
jgi:hypothetical protein